MAYCCCLLLRGYASAATGSQSPAELPLCTALRAEEVSPVFRHRLDLCGQGTGNCGRGFEPPRLPFGSRPAVEVSAIYATDRIAIRFVFSARPVLEASLRSRRNFSRAVKVL